MVCFKNQRKFDRWQAKQPRHGKEIKVPGMGGMARLDKVLKSDLVLLHNGKWIQLRQDMRLPNKYLDGAQSQDDLGNFVSSKAVVLQMTNPNKVEMPYEHLTYRRIDKIL